MTTLTERHPARALTPSLTDRLRFWLAEFRGLAGGRHLALPPHFARAGLALLLGTVLALEISVLPGGAADLQQASAPAAPRLADPGPAIVLPSWTADALARPLFSPSRLPPAAGGLPAAPAPLPRLTGILISPSQKLGIFCDAAGEPRIAAEGSRLGAYTILAVAAGGVELSGPDGVANLRLTGDLAMREAAGTEITTFPGTNAWPRQ